MSSRPAPDCRSSTVPIWLGAMIGLVLLAAVAVTIVVVNGGDNPPSDATDSSIGEETTAPLSDDEFSDDPTSDASSSSEFSDDFSDDFSEHFSDDFSDDSSEGDFGLGAAPQDAIAEYGSDPALDALADACYASIYASCDTLYSESPSGSGYEAYGDTCAGLQDLNTTRFCVEVFG